MGGVLLKNFWSTVKPLLWLMYRDLVILYFSFSVIGGAWSFGAWWGEGRGGVFFYFFFFFFFLKCLDDWNFQWTNDHCQNCRPFFLFSLLIGPFENLYLSVYSKRIGMHQQNHSPPVSHCIHVHWLLLVLLVLWCHLSRPHLFTERENC